MPEVAEALGVTQQSLRNWVKQEALDRRERNDGLTSAERGELRALRREDAHAEAADAAFFERFGGLTGD